MCFTARINENVNDDEDEHDIEFGNFDGDDDEIDEVSFFLSPLYLNLVDITMYIDIYIELLLCFYMAKY